MIAHQRTPASRFVNLPDYPFAPKYLELDDRLQMHFIDEGDKDGPVVLMLHGEPSWSFLYRKMVPVIVNAGYRAVVPDLIGFGKSDKPNETSAYTYQQHIEWLLNFVTKLKLENITLFCQDWGGCLGLRLAMMEQDRFSRIVAANTFLPNGMAPMPEAFKKWQEFVLKVPVFEIGRILDGATNTKLSDEIIAAYDAPFPDESFKAGARIFPSLVPTEPDDPEAVINQKYWQDLMAWQKPFLCLFSDNDPITKGAEKIFMKLVPGAKDQHHEIIVDAGHFLQEDQGKLIAEKVVAFMQST